MESKTSLTIFLSVVLLLLVILQPQAISAANGFGVLGDSGSDEHRANDNRGGSYGATTFNWIELLVRFRGIDAGPWGTRPEPRRTGYEYNWAKSGAKTADVINQGQAEGLAAQVAGGLVNKVYIQIGANDFSPWNGTYNDIYGGKLTSTQIEAKINAIVSNISSAVNKLKSAGSVKIALASYIERSFSPKFQQDFPDAAKRQKVSDVITETNNRLKNLAVTQSIAFIDLNSFATILHPQINAGGNYILAGESISFTTVGDEPHHFILGDNEHPGTIASGLLANFLITQFNSAFSLNLNQFSDSELLTNAGIGAATLSISPSAISPSVSPALSSDIKQGDANSDGKVDGVDYVIWLNNYNNSVTGTSLGDFNGNGFVDGIDYVIWLNNYGK